MSHAWGERGFRELSGLCSGGIRTWDGRYSDPDVNIVFKNNFVGGLFQLRKRISFSFLICKYLRRFVLITRSISSFYRE